MRIAILCNARSGSTSLFNYINCCLTSENKKFDVMFEPFNFRTSDSENKHKNIDKIIDKKNILIKTFLDDDGYPYESFNNYDDYLKWLQTFFDKIILLERENKRLQAESIIFHEKLSNNSKIPINWHKPRYYELSVEDEKNIQKLEKDLKAEAKVLDTISKNGFPLFTYEDIFIKKDTVKINQLNEYLGLRKYEKCIKLWIDAPHKIVRIPTKSKSLI
jgi:hypothetical protein